MQRELMDTKIKKYALEVLKILATEDRNLKTRLGYASTEIQDLLKLLEKEDAGSYSLYVQSLRSKLPERNITENIQYLSTSQAVDIANDLVSLILKIQVQE
jgi:hypothetical protein